MKTLIKIQNELKAPKNAYNSFGKYKYRSAEMILEAVKPLLKEYGCVLTLSDELVNIGDRYYIKATASMLTPERNFSTIAYAREDETKKGMDGSQITGTASSYARKYALNGLFLIDDTKDTDTDEYRKEREARAEAETTGDDIKEVERLAKEKNIPLTEICALGNAVELDDFDEKTRKECIKWLEQQEVRS